MKKLAAAVAPLLALPLALTGCSGAAGSQAQSEAAAKLAAGCQRNVKDPADQFVTANGNKVTLNLSEDKRKQLRAFSAKDVLAGTKPDPSKGGGSALDSMLVAMSVLVDAKCLAQKAGVPSDAQGIPKTGEWPNWTVGLDEYGVPTFTSTVK